MKTRDVIKKEFGERVKSLGLGFSGSQFDFLWSYIDSTLKQHDEEVIKKIEKIGEEVFESNKVPCPSCGEGVKDTDIKVRETWIYTSILDTLKGE